MKTLKQYGSGLAILLGIIFLSACSQTGGDEIDLTATFVAYGTPVVDATDFPRDVYSPLTVNRSCTAAILDDIQINTKRGDLVAWAPDGDVLAYVSPENGLWGWSKGMLVGWSPETGENEFTYEEIPAAGDVSWSPDGSRIAFVALRPEDNLFTILIYNLGTKEVTDLFPLENARTDNFSSMKGILRWEDDTTLLVMTSCGADCSRQIRVDFQLNTMTLLNEIRLADDVSLDPGTSETAGQVIIPTATLTPTFSATRITSTPTSLAVQTAAPEVVYMTAGSPDGTMYAFVDDKNTLWILFTETNEVYRVPQRLYGTEEMDWSPDSRYLALRSYGKVYVFDFQCQE